MERRLKERSEKMGIHLDQSMVHQFLQYEDLLVEWNQKMNLTAITDSEGIEEKHFLDSLTCIKVIKEKQFSLVDIGTGAGFPGIPIKIALPESKITLIDSLNKRINFLNTVIGDLDLKKIETYHGRAEEYARKDSFREHFDYAVARAVAKMNVLLEYCLPYVKPGGAFICQKGLEWKSELDEAKNAIKVLGGEVDECLDIKIPGTDYTRVIIVIRKKMETPGKYPRNQGKIDKKPL